VYTIPALPFPSNSIPQTKDLQDWPHLKGLVLPAIQSNEISLLIGADNPAVFKVLDEREGPADAPYAVKYPLGWTVIGPLMNTQDHHFTTNFTVYRS
jgi:hypothetical protein